MTHIRLLFVGSIINLDKIYADCPDSSSESAAEMAFGADWINEERYGGEFTKDNKEQYNKIFNKEYWGYCFDIRDTKRYGDYCCVNNLPWEKEEGPDFFEIESRNKDRCIEHIKQLPDDTVFFFADSHW